MAYTKTVWVNNDAPYLNATNLNKIEDGIFNNDASKLNKDFPIFSGTLDGPDANISGTLILASEQYQINEDGTDLILMHRNPANTALRIRADSLELILNSNGMFYDNVKVLLDNGPEIESKASISYVDTENNAQDTLINNNTTAIASKIEADDYATSTVGGTIKILVSGTDCYITTDGSTPGA